MMKSIYLDKISLSSHLPPKDGNLGNYKLTTLPDLSHTGLRTKLISKNRPATTPQGRLTPSYRQNCLKVGKSVENTLQKINTSQRHHEKASKSFINSMLCDLDTIKRERTARREQLWNTSKDSLGFNDFFDSASTTSYARSSTAGIVLPSLSESDCTVNNLDSNSLVSLDTKSSFALSKKTSASKHERKKHVFNRMTLFQCLLDTRPIPEVIHKRRFGVLQSRMGGENGSVTGSPGGSVVSRGSLGSPSVADWDDESIRQSLA